jgi:CubicO group peptidase (beta-lactamase class C family)
LKTRLDLCILPKLNISPEQDWESFLKSTNTSAFIVIKDGNIVCEKYSNGSSKDALQNSWSIAKSVISGLVGIALNDGLFQSIDDKITKYLPELVSVDVRYRNISLKNLLEMRSGINFSENYLNPFSDIENLMKSDDLLAYIKTIKISSAPDLKADYQSFNTLLLGLALQRAIKMDLTDYFQIKIWNPIGATHNAQWLSDKSNNPQYKSFCCIKATAHDFSKFALLYLNSRPCKIHTSTNYPFQGKRSASLNTQTLVQWRTIACKAIRI